MRRTAESVTEGLDLSGKTALVTGATSGLGRECARVLALRGARVVIACRDLAKGEETRRSISATTGEAAAGRCELRRCDVASLAAARALAETLLAERAGLDLLFLNAGVFNRPFERTAEGFEATYAANYLGHFLLVHTLAAAGGFAARARIVATLSEAVYLNPFARAELAMLTRPAEPSRFSRMGASPNTKVLLALMALEFARRAEAAGLPGVTYNGVTPPPTLTDNVNQGGPISRALGRGLGPLLFSPVEVGAASLLWAATSPALSGKTGLVFSHHLAERKLPMRSRDPELARRAWEETEAALGLAPWP